MTGPAEYIVASRNGLYHVHKAGWTKWRDGVFFGVAVRGGHIYCFETGESPGNPSGRGRILRLAADADGTADPDILAEGLDTGCHQVDFIGDAFFVVDTYRQAVLEFDRHWRLAATHHPLPPAGFNDWAGGYVHMNSIIGHGDRILLMLHKGNYGPSEVLVVDRAFRVRDRFALEGHRCHDFAFLEEGAMLYCDSAGGSLAIHGGPSIKIDTMLTRGLAVGPDEIAVGSSLFAERMGRRLVPGFVTFLDRAYRRLARLELPAAPTQIRRLDGRDLSVSRGS